MVSYQIDPYALKLLLKDLKRLGHIIVDPNMQLYRAKKYRDFTVQKVKYGALGMAPISSATERIQKRSSNIPEWNTGALLNKMGVRPAGKDAAEAGYFGKTEKIPGKKISWTGAAMAQHSGYRIPLTGDKGARVRAWLGDKERQIFPDKQSQWLVVHPRPFMFTSLVRYENEGADVQAVDEFLEKMMNSPIDLSTKRAKGESMGNNRSDFAGPFGNISASSMRVINAASYVGPFGNANMRVINASIRKGNVE